MKRTFLISMAAALALTACSTEGTYSRADGTTAKIYRIGAGQQSKIQYNMLDSVNALRQAAGKNPVVLNSQLNAAAATHSRDMSAQNRPWHFGSDGSSPIDRVARTGYPGLMLGEDISETYETELETLAAWMEEPGTRDVILESRAQNMGFAWVQEAGGKIWWTLLMGS
ncbi:CAP domain-containing protein [Aliiroseovarius lamellibrachiae]|uniref:CAP domain-containing protein n=1 Tax=Aliiroseovarius lamellibrachiae TaxID=1924933 RepID=UPI001BDF860C|nr:CAP domain-containing protein [Aliiroseovarius lamellibrachiae]MBT2131835.1 CAP domain-containing protein [Aliiroseovarius lamellibrachiae]